MEIEAILWDFGDTLVDETWMLAPLEGVPRWPETYRGLLGDNALARQWNAGAITSLDVARAFGRELGVAPERLLKHMEWCSRNIAFYPRMKAVTAQRRYPQAIVTVNPDIFSHVVVPHYRLDESFDAIVTSWQEQSASKPALCDAAIARLGGRWTRDRCLLVDNRQDCTEQWIAQGGRAYRFRGEDRFFADLGALFA
jgi:phosphoglycolate phosphatase-like HAD superfamily hydrolase